MPTSNPSVDSPSVFVKIPDKEKGVASVNHLGLMSEGLQPGTGRQVGNFPQGYSHMAFIQSAMLLETDYEWGSLRDAAGKPFED